MTKSDLCTKIMMYAEGHILFQEVVDAVDAYSSASNAAKPIISNSLPLNLTIYKNAKSMSYEEFCKWFNEQVDRQNIGIGSLPSRNDFLKTMLDWHEEYLKEGYFNIPLDHEQSEYLNWLSYRLAKFYGNGI